MPSLFPDVVRMLLCPLCKKDFKDNSRRPMIGLCGHTICSMCRSQLNKTTCPISESCNKFKLDHHFVDCFKNGRFRLKRKADNRPCPCKRKTVAARGAQYFKVPVFHIELERFAMKVEKRRKYLRNLQHECQEMKKEADEVKKKVDDVMERTKAEEERLAFLNDKLKEKEQNFVKTMTNCATCEEAVAKEQLMECIKCYNEGNGKPICATCSLSDHSDHGLQRQFIIDLGFEDNDIHDVSPSSSFDDCIIIDDDDDDKPIEILEKSLEILVVDDLNDTVVIDDSIHEASVIVLDESQRREDSIVFSDDIPAKEYKENNDVFVLKSPEEVHEAAPFSQIKRKTRKSIAPRRSEAHVLQPAIWMDLLE